MRLSGHHNISVHNNEHEYSAIQFMSDVNSVSEKPTFLVVHFYGMVNSLIYTTRPLASRTRKT